ncbi:MULTISPECIES: hypothetical protein [Nostocales]|jgi:hypothetical protein|uniref:Uncharacterized protein n=1 Tax=Sphaerospermopsis aphanizomenoides LEGE 00250 TaxID=2777972 RepID=A0ABR9VD70_9CYAN|nr:MULTISPECIES: hypothetical protein [Nostocales]MDK2408750.1 hypothetical protein [Aphanizomenon sp. 202]MDK2458457.1 hypothetical protein [Aphanizomenon sp. PH219]MDM3850229.1 hypothetical protein [Aphanizomenon gracile PMC627.10]QSV70882.1 MAG: hypothetical protein HEQ20_09095 [Aphanizomenon flos-aquae KM1D3_PB]KHG42805.1 hypothetical protein OA07_02895 [Aphanizomenon flos-aquae 2012/KM1/D3]
MTIPITINLPESLAASIQRLGEATAREISDVLLDTLEIVLPTLDNLSEMSINSSIPDISDEEVLELANLKMDVVQNQRLGELQAKGKNTGLTAGERYELLILMSLYQMGQLRKSEGLAEAVKRGIKTPLSP